MLWNRWSGLGMCYEFRSIVLLCSWNVFGGEVTYPGFVIDLTWHFDKRCEKAQETTIPSMAFSSGAACCHSLPFYCYLMYVGRCCPLQSDGWCDQGSVFRLWKRLKAPASGTDRARWQPSRSACSDAAQDWPLRRSTCCRSCRLLLMRRRRGGALLHPALIRIEACLTGRVKWWEGPVIELELCLRSSCEVCSQFGIGKNTMRWNELFIVFTVDLLFFSWVMPDVKSLKLYIGLSAYARWQKKNLRQTDL